MISILAPNDLKMYKEEKVLFCNFPRLLGLCHIPIFPIHSPLPLVDFLLHFPISSIIYLYIRCCLTTVHSYGS